MFVGGGPRGDCPSFERRRDLRGGAAPESKGSAGFGAALSEQGSSAADTAEAWTSDFCSGSIDGTSSFLGTASG